MGTSLDKAFALVDLVASGKTTLSELAEAGQMPRSTAHRLLGDLVERRVLTRSGRAYRLGIRLLQLGEQVRRQLRLPALADEPMRKLATETHETVHLGILDASHVVYIAKVEGRRGLQMASHVGLQSPAQTTAMGKVLLASLPPGEWERRYMKLVPATPHSITDREGFVRELGEVRAQGFAFDREENEVGIRCVAAPVIDASNDVVAAISLSGASVFVTEERQRSLVPAVIACARSISAELGATFEGGDTA